MRRISHTRNSTHSKTKKTTIYRSLVGAMEMVLSFKNTDGNVFLMVFYFVYIALQYMQSSGCLRELQRNKIKAFVHGFKYISKFQPLLFHIFTRCRTRTPRPPPRLCWQRLALSFVEGGRRFFRRSR